MNLAQDARVKNIMETTAFGVQNTTDLKIAFETGFDFNIGIGIPLGGSDAWSLEVMTGLAYNSVESVSGQYDTDLFGFVVQGSMTGGNGDLYQVPIVANLRYEFDLSECLTLGLYAGGGVQYTNLGINGVQVLDPAFPGGAVDDVGLSSFNGWAFRYQAGLDLNWGISNNTTIGLNVRYSGTTDTDFGSFYGSSFTVKNFQNLAIGATFSLTF